MEALQRLHNRGSISTGYDIDNSLKLEQDNSERLIRNTPAITTVTNATVSYWVKRTELGTGTMYTWKGGSTWQNAAITNPAGYSDVLYVAGGNESYYKLVTNRVFRDTSAWYHIFIAYDTTQSTASDRIKIYINGVQETSFAVENYPAQNRDLEFLASNGAWIFGWYETAASVSPCYLAEAYLFHDQTLAHTDFGEFDADTGIWKPIEFTGSFSQYDWYYDFENASSLGADASGNGNDITYTYNITSADQATDTPTNNFCILNTNFKGNNYRAPVDGGTYIDMNGINAHTAYAGTMGVTKGKWYFESYIDMRSSNYGLEMWIGFHTFKDDYDNNAYWSSTNQDSLAMYYPHLGYYYSWSGGSRVIDTSLGSIGTAGVGKYIGYALNLDDNEITFYYDGNAITNGSNLALNNLGTDTDNGIFAIPAISVYDNNHTVNFGGYTRAPISSPQSDANGYGTFEHAPPSGYYALCSKNLAEYG